MTPPGAADAAFTDAANGMVASTDGLGARLPVFATHDGGKAWQRLHVPGAHALDSVCDGPGAVAVIDGAHAFVTADYGQSWHTLPSGKGALGCVLSRPTTSAIWLVFNGTPTTLVISNDGGRTWTLRTTRLPVDPLTPGFEAVSGREAWLASFEPNPRRAQRIDAPGKLWHTTEAGATWQEAWVQLSPSARVRSVTTGARVANVYIG
ncbi:MAG: hypothetical protein ACRDNM_02195 [Gaiellaceae bacterium]